MGLGAVIMGGASLIGGGISALGSMSAANTQASYQKQALAQEQQMFGTAQGALQPYITAGANALPTLSALTNPGTSASTLSTMPGFQFQQQYGTMATQNALAAQGLGKSAGPLGQALSQYNQGLAGTYWQNSVNALQNYANMGAGAGGNLSAAAINSGNTQGSTIANIGSASAAGTLGATNALAGGVQGVGNAAILSSFLGNKGLYGSGASNLFGANGSMAGY